MNSNQPNFRNYWEEQKGLLRLCTYTHIMLYVEYSSIPQFFKGYSRIRKMKVKRIIKGMDWLLHKELLNKL